MWGLGPFMIVLTARRFFASQEVVKALVHAPADARGGDESKANPYKSKYSSRPCSNEQARRARSDDVFCAEGLR